MAALAGFDGRRQLVLREVADPYDGEHLTVIGNVLESPLALLRHRGMISEGEKLAGDRFRAIYERSIIGGARAIDYRQPKVDGGTLFDPLHSSSAEAARTLKGVARIVGEIDFRLLVAVVGEGRRIVDVAGQGASTRARLHCGARLRDALHLLAVRWGFELEGVDRACA